LEEKRTIVDESYEPGMTVSYVARKHGISPSQVFNWRKQYEAGALVAVGCEDRVVPEREVTDLRRQIRRLERVLGQKTLENEILREAVRIGREKKLISRRPLSGIDDLD
jgi:transposase